MVVVGDDVLLYVRVFVHSVDVVVVGVEVVVRFLAGAVEVRVRFLAVAVAVAVALTVRFLAVAVAVALLRTGMMGLGMKAVATGIR